MSFRSFLRVDQKGGISPLILVLFIGLLLTTGIDFIWRATNPSVQICKTRWTAVFSPQPRCRRHWMPRRR